ncbi:MAG: PH domain-containing protein [Alphaproteobacteria bacterium]|nr:PH domain-containing protein [Alphaproteobacteria bacterium]
MSDATEDKKKEKPVVERQKRKRKSFNGIALRDGETPVLNARISIGIFWKAAAVVIIALLIGLLAWQLGVFLLLVACLTASIAALTRRFLFLALTDQRVLMRRGIIKIDTMQLRLDSIESVEVQRTIVGQFLGYASIVITGIGSRFTIIPFVENAVEFRDMLDDALYAKDNASNDKK